MSPMRAVPLPLAWRRLGLKRPHPNWRNSPPSQSTPSTTKRISLGPPSDDGHQMVSSAAREEAGIAVPAFSVRPSLSTYFHRAARGGLQGQALAVGGTVVEDGLAGGAIGEFEPGLDGEAGRADPWCHSRRAWHRGKGTPADWEAPLRRAWSGLSQEVPAAGLRGAMPVAVNWFQRASSRAGETSWTLAMSFWVWREVEHAILLDQNRIAHANVGVVVVEDDLRLGPADFATGGGIDLLAAAEPHRIAILVGDAGSARVLADGRRHRGCGTSRGTCRSRTSRRSSPPAGASSADRWHSAGSGAPSKCGPPSRL